MQTLQTPQGRLAWDQSRTGSTPGFAFRATLNGRQISDDSLVALLVLYAPEGF